MCRLSLMWQTWWRARSVTLVALFFVKKFPVCCIQLWLGFTDDESQFLLSLSLPVDAWGTFNFGYRLGLSGAGSVQPTAFGSLARSSTWKLEGQTMKGKAMTVDRINALETDKFVTRKIQIFVSNLEVGHNKFTPHEIGTMSSFRKLTIQKHHNLTD